MIRNLKALGMALCAVFMFGALSASAASAEISDVLTSGSLSGTTHLTGTQIGGKGASNQFGVKSSAASVTCNTAKYSGTFTGSSATAVEVTPEYKECEGLGLSATVDDEGCKFSLTGTTDKYFNTSNVEVGRDATVHLVCNHTGQIRVTAAFGCILTFKDTSGANTVNQNLLGVRYDNELEANGKWDIKVTVTVDKIHYTSNGPCQSLGFAATGNDGFLTTNVTATAYEDAAHTKQVNLTVS